MVQPRSLGEEWRPKMGNGRVMPTCAGIEGVANCSSLGFRVLRFLNIDNLTNLEDADYGAFCSTFLSASIQGKDRLKRLTIGTLFRSAPV